MNNRANWMLMRAARKGDTKGILRALDNGADINYRGDALQEAISNNHLNAVKLLLKKGARVNYRHTLSARNNVKMMEMLIEEGGLNVREDNSYLLRSTAVQTGEHNHVMIAFLMEKGAHVEKYEVDYGKLETLASVADTSLHANLEKLARAYAHEGSVKSVRRLIFQSVAIAGSLGLHWYEIKDFVTQSMKANLEKGRFLLSPEEDFIGIKPLDRLAEKIGLEGYQHAPEMKDMLTEYIDTVLLPQFILDARLLKKLDKFDGDYKNQTLHYVIERLMPVAAQLVLGGKRLDEILAMSAAWHRGGNHIPDDMRPLQRGEWGQLMQDVTYQPPGKEPLVIHALSTQHELSHESTVLNHCVGRGGYASKCMQGRSYILSIRRDEVPIATLEVSLTNDPREPLHLIQIKGRNNHEPPQEAKQAWTWFLKEISKGHIVITPPAPPKVEPTQKDVPKVFQRIGFVPSAKNINACLSHYHNHLLLKSPTWTRRRSETSFGAPPAYEQGHKWTNAISRQNIHELIRENNLQEDWNKIIEIVNPDLFRKSHTARAARKSPPPAMAH